MHLPEKVEAIQTAMRRMVPMSAKYHDRERVFSPLLLGRTRAGVWVVNAYQFAGDSSADPGLCHGPRHRMFLVEELVDLAERPDEPWRAPERAPEHDPKGLVEVLARARRSRFHPGAAS